MGTSMPPKRAGHSMVIYQDSLVIFGGKDEENSKLNDVWEFNLNTYQWTEFRLDEPPLPRSGHSAYVYRDFMIIFGGIHEVTKELDDMLIYDFKNKRWI
jgi:N-acetylneuraminic acid mutarotase